ncbi:unnamed protein product [Tetraodon nigroviridis]|uniref:Chromosome 18 SCAF15027, whole genome shotgun sequence n=1 Tax=Tetraodon nigroviridis TaxID=99883 RepID=Q4RKM0_TETNG|nr:unnamed protein product [Tetraodon nigroviridis]
MIFKRLPISLGAVHNSPSKSPVLPLEDTEGTRGPQSRGSQASVARCQRSPGLCHREDCGTNTQPPYSPLSSKLASLHSLRISLFSRLPGFRSAYLCGAAAVCSLFHAAPAVTGRECLWEHQKEEDPRRAFEEPTDTPLWVLFASAGITSRHLIGPDSVRPHAGSLSSLCSLNPLQPILFPIQPPPHPSPDHQLVKPVPLTAPLQRWRHRGAEMQRGATGAVGGGGPMKDTAPWVAER